MTTFDLFIPLFVIPFNLICDQGILRRYRLSYTELYENIPWLTNTADGLVTLTHGDKVLTTPHCLLKCIISLRHRFFNQSDCIIYALIQSEIVPQRTFLIVGDNSLFKKM